MKLYIFQAWGAYFGGGLAILARNQGEAEAVWQRYCEDNARSYYINEGQYGRDVDDTPLLWDETQTNRERVYSDGSRGRIHTAWVLLETFDVSESRPRVVLHNAHDG